MTNVVLTGMVRIGKTAVCQAVIELVRQRGYCVHGILTPAVLDQTGVRQSVEVLDLSSGERRLLARVCPPDAEVPFALPDGWPRIGSYCFDPAGLQWGADALARAIGEGCDLLVVDEIGRLELEHNIGYAGVLDLLATSVVPRSLLVVRTALLEAFHRRLPGLRPIVFEVTVDNRSALPVEIAERLFLT